MAVYRFKKIGYRDAVRRIGEHEARWNTPWARLYRQKNLANALKAQYVSEFEEAPVQKEKVRARVG